MSDRITLLRCHDSLVLAKRIEPDGEGWKVTPYDSTASYAWSQREVASVDDIHGVLTDIASDPRVCVIRGEPMGHVKPGDIVNRRANVGADGEGPDWEEARPGRRWVAFDFDGASVATTLLGNLWGTQAAFALRKTLPYQFRDARCVYKLSSSAALYGRDKVSMHLWFWLDRPICNMSWRAWMKARKIDASFFTPVQPHFTADPVFVGVEDPLKGCRMGILLGAEVVTAPPELMDLDEWEAEQDRQRAARPKPERVNVDDGKRRPAQEKYALAALQSAVDEIQSAGEGGRHDAAFRQAYSIGGYVGAGVLDWGLARDAITDAICSVVPANRHAKEAASVAEGIELGFKKPRDMSRIGTRAGEVARPKLSLAPTPSRKIEEGSAAVKIEAYDMGGDEVERTLAKESARKRQIELGAIPDYPDLSGKGKVLTTAANLEVLLKSMGLSCWRNLMTHNTEWDRADKAEAIPRECLQATMESNVLDAATRTGWNLSKDAFWGRVSAIEAHNAVHPVAEWVRSNPWDGVSRLDELFATLIFSVEHERFADLLRMQFRKWVIAGGKCLTADPNSAKGVDVQGVLVLQGPQDIGKTRWFKSLVPDSSWIREGVTMDPSNTDSVISATSSFIVELGELDATTRKSDVAMLKSFLTRDVDEYRAAYGRKSEAYPRRTLYGATVNPSDFLVDQTGNRRFWTMPCIGIVHPGHIDMQQLWAEACVLAQTEGHWMPAEFKEAQQELAKVFAKRSPWADDFYNRFRRPREDESGRRRMSVSAIREAVDRDRHWNQSDMLSFTAFLRAEGFDCALERGVMHARVVDV